MSSLSWGLGRGSIPSLASCASVACVQRGVGAASVPCALRLRVCVCVFVCVQCVLCSPSRAAYNRVLSSEILSCVC